MSNKNKVKFGLKNVHVAPLTETDGGIFYFGTPQKIPGAVNLSLPPVGETTPFYADDIEYFTSMTNNGYEGNIEFALVPDWFKAKYLGEEVDENFVQIERAGVQPSPFALMFEFDGDKRKTRHVLYNCKANRPNIEGETKQNTTTPKTESLPLVVKPLGDTMIVKGRTNEKTPDTVYNGWYDDVYGMTSVAAAISPKTATFSKATPADVSTDVSNDEATDVQIAGASIGSGNFTITSGTVKIKKEYLSTLTEGAKPFAIVMDSGAEKTFTVTVTA